MTNTKENISFLIAKNAGFSKKRLVYIYAKVLVDNNIKSDDTDKSFLLLGLKLQRMIKEN